jgi:tetratricopeptide (TPR) repeat protein
LALVAVIALGAWVAGVNLWAGYHLQAARSSLDKYHNAEAIDHLRACMTVWPHHPETLLLAARAARRQGEFAQAESFQDQYRRARGSEDDDLILEDMLLLAQRGEVLRAARFCKQLVEDGHPATPLILEAMANGYLNRFRLQDAMACLQDWLKRQPDNPQAVFLEGRVYDQGLNLRQALTCYRRALRLDPEHDDARQYLAGKLLDLAQAPEALPHLKYLRERLPDNPLIPVLLARCRHQLGQVAAAERILDEQLARAPNDSLALTERGSLALQRGQVKAAEAWLRRAAVRDPGNYLAHFLWHQALLRAGRDDEARQVQEHLKQMKKDMDRIMEIVTEKMQKSPRDPALLCETGLIALRAGAIDQGLEWLQSALTENPRYLPAHQALADFYERAGSPGRAAQHRRAIAMARGASATAGAREGVR